MLINFKYLFLFLTATSVALGSITCQADDLSFFPGKEKNVRNIFGDELKIEKAYFKSEENLKPTEKSETQPAPSHPITVKDQIIAEYGDPAKPHEVTAIKDAPKPFKGMIEALKSGDKKLAFDYAVQYQQYLENLEKINKEMVSIQGIAMYKNGQIPEDNWVRSELDKNPDLKPFVDNDQALEDRAGVIAKEAQDLLITVKRKDYDLFAGSNVEKKELETDERAKARQELTGKVPYIPSGDIEVYLFLKPTEQQSINQGIELQKIYAKRQDEDQINIFGFSVEPHSESKLGAFKSATGAQFITLVSADLATKLNITNTPTIMVLDPITTKFYQLNNVVSASYLDEMFKIIRGK